MACQTAGASKAKVPLIGRLPSIISSVCPVRFNSRDGASE